MSEAVFQLLPGTVPSTTEGHGRTVLVLDLNGDGKPELIIADGPVNTQAPWDGVQDLYPPLLTLSYSAITGLSSMSFLDQTGNPVRVGSADDILVGDFYGSGRQSFIIVSGGPEVLVPNAAPNSANYVLDQLKLVAPNGAGGATVTKATLGYPNQGYATSFPQSGWGYWHSAASGDFNGDGKLDFIAVSLQAGVGFGPGADFSIRLATFLNSGSGQFTYTPGYLPSSFYQVPLNGGFGANPPSVLASGDFNGDGRADLVWGTQHYGNTSELAPVIARANRVYLNTGTGFSDAAQLTLPFPAASDFAAKGVDINAIYADRIRVADLNGDGLQDIIFTLAVTSVGAAANDPTFGQVWLQNPDHTFRDLSIWPNHALPTRSGVIEAIDVNGDGLLDLVSNTGALANVRDAASNVWINMGDETFRTLASLAPNALTATGSTTSWWFANLDGAGAAELVIATPNQAHTASTISVFALQPASIQATAGVAAGGTIFSDQITGSAGADSIAAGLGHDVVSGGAGADTIYGGLGDDTVEGGDGLNFLRGEGGNDSLTGGAEFDDMHGNTGNDTVRGAGGGDWVVGGQGNDMLFGDDGGDVVYGNLANDTCEGGAGNDWVRGGQGDDSISGGAGDDLIWGDRGADTISGGSGADTFTIFGEAGIDRILDFNAAEGDRIRVEAGYTFNSAQVGADTVVTLSGGAQLILVGVQLSTLPTTWIFQS